MSFVFQTHYQGDDPSVLVDNMGLFNELVKGSGSSGMLLFQQIAAGELTGLCVAASMWDSVQGGWNGLSAMYADPRIQEIATSATSPTAIARNVTKLEREHGNPGPGYAGWTSFQGDSVNDEEFANITAIADKNGVTAVRMLNNMAAGSNSGTRTAVFYCDSLDNWAEMMAELTTDPSFIAGASRTGFLPVARGLAVVH